MSEETKACTVCGAWIGPNNATGVGSGCARKFKTGTKLSRRTAATVAVSRAHQYGRTFWDVLPEVEAELLEATKMLAAKAQEAVAIMTARKGDQ